VALLPVRTLIGSFVRRRRRISVSSAYATLDLMAARIAQELLEQVLFGRVSALDHLKMCDLEDLHTVEPQTYFVDASAFAAVLRRLQEGQLTAPAVQAWASFVRRGYWATSSSGPVLPIDIEFDPRCEQTVADILARLDELGDTLDGTISAVEGIELLGRLEGCGR
jgi:hypothetical protein